jgi:uncharacterized protein YlzI (FlbEa/FlbD family)
MSDFITLNCRYSIVSLCKYHISSIDQARTVTGDIAKKYVVITMNNGKEYSVLESVEEIKELLKHESTKDWGYA